MNKVQETFLKIVKLSLKNELLLENPLTDEEWYELFNLAMSHHVLSMVYGVIYKLDIDRNLLMQVKRQAIMFAGMQAQKTMQFLNLYQYIQQQGITLLVFKGITCRNIYPNSDYRISGDEDMLVLKKDFKKLDELLVGLGYNRDKEYDEHIDEMGYHHPNGLYLEVHCDLFSRDSTYSFLNVEFEDIFKHIECIHIQGVDVYTFSYTKHLFYLFAHSFKHFVHGGFGIRQVCDMIMFMKAYSEFIDYDEFESYIYKYKLDSLWFSLMKIANMYLGNDTKYHNINYDIDINDLLLDILASGVYGKSTSERQHSANMTLSALDKQSSSMKQVWNSLFPNKEYIYNKYEYARKYKFLLPYAYMQRIYEYTKNTHTSSKTIELGMQRVKLLKKYKVIK